MFSWFFGNLQVQETLGGCNFMEWCVKHGTDSSTGKDPQNLDLDHLLSSAMKGFCCTKLGGCQAHSAKRLTSGFLFGTVTCIGRFNDWGSIILIPDKIFHLLFSEHPWTWTDRYETVSGLSSQGFWPCWLVMVAPRVNLHGQHRSCHWKEIDSIDMQKSRKIFRFGVVLSRLKLPSCFLLLKLGCSLEDIEAFLQYIYYHNWYVGNHGASPSECSLATSHRAHTRVLKKHSWSWMM